MSITNKKPPYKETVGAQYVCFDNMAEGEYTGKYETDVEKTEVVKKVKVKENAESADIYGSGAVYATNDNMSTMDIEVEVIAFPADTLAKMRGDNVDEGGLVLSGGKTVRPYFAYGKVVKLASGKERFEWFPKCKLVENSDEASTKTDKFAEQSDTITIAAYPFDKEGNVRAAVDSTMKAFPVGLTEEKFFSKPILTKEDLKTAVGSLPV